MFVVRILDWLSPSNAVRVDQNDRLGPDLFGNFGNVVMGRGAGVILSNGTE